MGGQRLRGGGAGVQGKGACTDSRIHTHAEEETWWATGSNGLVLRG